MKQKVKKRTTRQSRALHLWCDLLAQDLNDSGYSIAKTMKYNVDVPWSMITVKEILFKQIMKAMYQKESTTELTTKELSNVSETLIRHLGQRLGIQTDFPSLESLRMTELTTNKKGAT